MKLLIIFLMVSFATTGVFSKKRRGGYKEAILSCNHYIDELLSHILANHSAILEPYITEDSKLIFHRKVVFVDVQGEAKLASGHLTGLSNLHRVSSCAMSFENERLMLSAKLQIPGIEFHTAGSLKFLKMGPEITVKADTADIIVNMGLTLNFTTGREALLEEFNVDHFNEIHTSIGGLRMMKWMTSAVQNSASSLVKIIIKNAVGYRMQYFVHEYIIAHPFSLEDFDIDESEIFGTTEDATATTPFGDDIPTGKTAYTIEDADKYMDSVIENRFIIEADYSKLDPYSLKDVLIDSVFIQTEENSTEGVSNEENNTLKLRNGHIKGLSTLKRVFHCTKPISKASNITFVCTLSFDEIELKYEASNGDDVFDYDMIASVINSKVIGRITSNQIDNIPYLQEFALCNTGTFTIKAAKAITNSTCFSDRPYNEEPILRHFRVSLAEALNGRMKEALGYSVYRSPLDFLSL